MDNTSVNFSLSFLLFFHSVGPSRKKCPSVSGLKSILVRAPHKESGNINADAKHVPTASNMQFCVYLTCIKKNGDVLCMYWNVHYKK